MRVIDDDYRDDAMRWTVMRLEMPYSRVFFHTSG